ncbi:TATA box-binding protein-associated factor RNA polymerase I subunit A [Xyrichtys novacula]|uniref:TATA box-binding protein-associated factor RNA polymerase I subunit A n=1 Tax=Xyrichtys novacula TaxID=13765 RepID=A0AAV1GV36_XYRNO|nr:TATA box-binding protein-associated factor RNA polymerase I subunit A [Xyrichtys novacula]
MDESEEEVGPLEDPTDGDDCSENGSTRSRRERKPPVAEPVCEETQFETGYHRSTRMCLKRIRDAVLHHRWQEAAEYMACFSQMFEDPTHNSAQENKEIIWRLGTEILHHLPNSKKADYNNIYELIKHTSVRHYLMVSLEHSFHLLLKGEFNDAKHQMTVAESWRHGRESATQSKKIKLIQAYRSLLDHLIWCDRKFEQSNTDRSDDTEMHSNFRQASVSLREILRNPGVWDPFILSYVEMLDIYEDHTEALNVLEKYANDSSFPPNPNAHVYLYQFLKRHDFPVKEKRKVLKVLQVLVPSHELMLEYSAILLHSEKTKDTQKALEVVLGMLDFSCWRNSLDVWERLKDSIQKLQSKKDWEKVVAEKMAPRKDWWPALHFTSFHAGVDSVENPELMTVKASLTKILCPDLNLKYSAETRGTQTESRPFKRVRRTCPDEAP